MTTTPTVPKVSDYGKYQFFPWLEGEEYQQLKEDIRHKGVVVPIEFDENGAIIDGHNRFRAYSELIEEGADIPMFSSSKRKFASEAAKVEYVMALNLKRRHLTPAQRTEMIVKMRKPPFGYTMSRIAEILGVSIATVSRALDSLPAQERDEMKSLYIQGADGRSYSANYAPRIDLDEGHESLRKFAQQQADKAAATVRKNFQPTKEQLAAIKTSQQSVPTAPAPPATPVTPPSGGAPPPTTTPETTPNGTTDSFTNLVANSVRRLSDGDVVARLSAMPYYGGKQSQLSWLLPLLPPAKHFIDLFGGSAAILLNRKPSPVETYNDLDEGVVNFFKVLRDKPEELLRLLVLTPYSREERRHAYRLIDKDSSLSDVERARLFYVLARQTRAQMAQRANNMLNSWRFSRDAIQNGLSTYVAQWQTAIDGLALVAARLRNVQIEQYPATRIIELYDNDETLIYADPPYVLSTRAADKQDIYAHEMTDEDHTLLSQKLHAFKGLVAVSGYRCALYDELYSDWDRIDMPTHAASAVKSGFNNSEANERLECLWTNYPLLEQPNAS